MLPTDPNSQLAGGAAAIMRVLRRLGHDIPVEVQAVHNSGLNPTGTVDVLPLVSMQDGAGISYPHDVIYGVPFIRIQGGARAFICDPMPGDNGVIVVCGRDISNVKANRAAAAPGSFRLFDFADAVYFGGLLNEAPTEYIGWVGGNVVVETVGQFIVNAASAQFNCAVTATGNVIGAAISLDSHVHPGVTTGGGTTGLPEG
jgi:hypothetical protein